MSNMVVANNLLAVNSHRNLKGIGNKQSQASSRLSSGFRINSAADDAAGLGISEKMRAQIRGLDMASKNAQDGISLIQTAEGGMQEIDNMLQRIRELVDQAANDTNEHNEEGTGDRQKIQDEINQLTAEIDSMADRVEFNKKKVIDGSYADVTEQLADAKNALALAKANESGNTVGTLDATQKASVASAYAKAAGSAGALKASYETIKASGSGLKASAGGLKASGIGLEASGIGLSASGVGLVASGEGLKASGEGLKASGQALLDAAKELNDAASELSGTAAANKMKSAAAKMQSGAAKMQSAETKIASAETKIASAGTKTASAATKAASAATKEASSYIKIASSDVKFASAEVKGASAAEKQAEADKLKAMLEPTDSGTDSSLKVQALSAKVKALEAQAGGEQSSLYFQVGANAFQGMELNVGSAKTDVLGIGKGNGESTIDVLHDTGKDITGYLDVLDVALSYVTTERSKLGAAQNRLDYTIKSLDISSENLQAAESRIRDTDMAKEMMKLTQANVLQQAATSMLAQANQAPQNVLQLLG